MNIKILRYHKIDKGTLIGIAQILFSDLGLTVNGVKVIASRNGDHFYSFPQEKYQDKETGADKWRDHCAFYDKDLNKEFYDSMVSALKVYHQENIAPQPAAHPNYQQQPLPTQNYAQPTPAAPAREQQFNSFGNGELPF